MIYLENTTSAQSVRFPSAQWSNAGQRRLPITAARILTLTNTATRKVEHMQSFRTIVEESCYITLQVALTEVIPNGEYEYILTAGDDVTLGKGIAQVGEYSRRMTEGTAAFELKQAK